MLNIRLQAGERLVFAVRGNGGTNGGRRAVSTGSTTAALVCEDTVGQSAETVVGVCGTTTSLGDGSEEVGARGLKSSQRRKVSL